MTGRALFCCTPARHRCSTCGDPIGLTHAYRGGRRQAGWRHLDPGQRGHQARHSIADCRAEGGWAA